MPIPNADPQSERATNRLLHGLLPEEQDLHETRLTVGSATVDGFSVLNMVSEALRRGMGHTGRKKLSHSRMQ